MSYLFQKKIRVPRPSLLQTVTHCFCNPEENLAFVLHLCYKPSTRRLTPNNAGMAPFRDVVLKIGNIQWSKAL